MHVQTYHCSKLRQTKEAPFSISFHTYHVTACYLSVAAAGYMAGAPGGSAEMYMAAPHGYPPTPQYYNEHYYPAHHPAAYYNRHPPPPPPQPQPQPQHRPRCVHTDAAIPRSVSSTVYVSDITFEFFATASLWSWSSFMSLCKGQGEKYNLLIFYSIFTALS